MEEKVHLKRVCIPKMRAGTCQCVEMAMIQICLDSGSSLNLQVTQLFYTFSSIRVNLDLCDAIVKTLS